MFQSNTNGVGVVDTDVLPWWAWFLISVLFPGFGLIVFYLRRMCLLRALEAYIREMEIAEMAQNVEIEANNRDRVSVKSGDNVPAGANADVPVHLNNHLPANLADCDVEICGPNANANTNVNVNANANINYNVNGDVNSNANINANLYPNINENINVNNQGTQKLNSQSELNSNLVTSVKIEVTPKN